MAFPGDIENYNLIESVFFFPGVFFRESNTCWSSHASVALIKISVPIPSSVAILIKIQRADQLEVFHLRVGELRFNNAGNFVA